MATAKQGFQVMAKPVGAICNLDCGYCYYLEKEQLYPKSQSHRMADDLLEIYIIQHIEASPDETIFFSWHGGEPTLLGIGYFQRIMELQERHRPDGRKIANGIQTNGTLIDEEWCRFLAANRFYVGLSIDGPKYLHDHYRVTKKAEATYKQVLQAHRLFKKHRIHCDLLCVVSERNARQPVLVYRFFRDLGIDFLQFLPLVIRDGESGVKQESVPAKLYGEFLGAVFDEWVRATMSGASRSTTSKRRCGPISAWTIRSVCCGKPAAMSWSSNILASFFPAIISSTQSICLVISGRRRWSI